MGDPRFGALALSAALAACAQPPGDAMYFGKVDPPEGQTLRFSQGPEPLSIDPPVSIGVNEAFIVGALFEGLVINDPKTSAPIPGIAESWDINDISTQFTFHLRKGARFSNGDPITAADVVWSLRRLLDPRLAADYAWIAYPILYAEGYNSRASFVRDKATGDFELDPKTHARRSVGPATAPPPGKELVPIRAEDVGVEALDPSTVRFTLTQSAPYFLSILPNPFFMIVHRRTIEAYGDADWVRPENIVTSGPFHLVQWEPYDRIVVAKSPTYWDAASVRLDEIRFYPIEDVTAGMNLYRAGAVDTGRLPGPWLGRMVRYRDFVSSAVLRTTFLRINTTRPPMDDVRVRKAFSLSLDRAVLARFAHGTKLNGIVPGELFPGYPTLRGVAFDPERARALLAEAGYRGATGGFDPALFPVDKIEYVYPALDFLRQIAEMLQAQWKQHLGITVPIRSLEPRIYNQLVYSVGYDGLSFSGWTADYVDPNTFTSMFQAPTGANGTGWSSESYADRLDEANRTRDPVARYKKMAEAEQELLAESPVIPLWIENTVWMKKPYVKGMYTNPVLFFPWKFVSIEHDRMKWGDEAKDVKP